VVLGLEAQAAGNRKRRGSRRIAGRMDNEHNGRPFFP
jgi:hypothetical protein